VVKKGFNLWPLTLKILPLPGSDISSAPWGNIVCTVKGPDHQVFNLPAKRCSLELSSRTCCTGIKKFWCKERSWKRLVLLLVILALSYASFRISSNSKIYSFRKSPTLFKSKLSCLIAHKARCSSSTGRWQGFSNTTYRGQSCRQSDKPIVHL